ncbi:GTP 3',8-cyclase [Fusobacterium sp. DD29]|uniref:radical SAM protein n=1 Tax=unclassified Fusobacterium TaxID=2648384 RepID=UPI001B8B7F0E|nr:MULTISPECIES: radical SAM protein [unclassified Fusobacterium]MBR8701439.1 GTP 3',8-cyclase [Fusobacterium sp. DD45]MBR8711175.1 GTP 3',8-cyclase [Fusobacterium sp. DD28]MBR8749662.1 GTP 3',8-cyclase [Fusobacterium sp. DD29]MBR8751749.1 GTP 3',8-cyclase [Fusobacterium sp. DD26]MBR8761923.1 GTP 3',8-cyclase [Fusobacterium sp. DD25]
MSKELCWLLTSRCNQQCKYCHRFLNSNENSDKFYDKVINKLASMNIKHITLGGGEPFLAGNIRKIIELLNEKGIKVKVVTNGTLVISDFMNIIDKLENITLSIDSVEDDINEKLGRGKEHFSTIEKLLNTLCKGGIKPTVSINSVITKDNINGLKKLSVFLKKYKIKNWRIFRFCPLRETALKNKELLEITNEEFLNLKSEILSEDYPFSVDFRNYEDMSSKYLLITPDAKLSLSDNLDDKILGDIINDDLREYF